MLAVSPVSHDGRGLKLSTNNLPVVLIVSRPSVMTGVG